MESDLIGSIVIWLDVVSSDLISSDLVPRAPIWSSLIYWCTVLHTVVWSDVLWSDYSKSDLLSYTIRCVDIPLNATSVTAYLASGLRGACRILWSISERRNENWRDGAWRLSRPLVLASYFTSRGPEQVRGPRTVAPCKCPWAALYCTEPVDSEIPDTEIHSVRLMNAGFKYLIRLLCYYAFLCFRILCSIRKSVCAFESINTVMIFTHFSQNW